MVTAFLHPDAPARPPEIAKAVEALTALAPGVDYRVYGSRWPMHLAGRQSPATSDVDIQIGWDDWLQLPANVRQQFDIHPPHLNYLRAVWRANSGKPQYAHYSGMVGDDRLPKGNIWVLRSNSALAAGIGAPLELVVARRLASPEKLMGDTPVGAFRAVDTPQGLYVSQETLDDIVAQALVWRKPIASQRALRRDWAFMRKHAGRLGWRCEVAPENLGWFDLT